MFETKKVFQSLKLIEGLYSRTQINVVAFSGGKDSIVLFDLAKRTGLDFQYLYTNTTIDPPGHVKFIRNSYSDVEILQPRYSFYQLVQKYGLPTRHRRFCCQHLKEYAGKKCKVFEGLRIEESIKRGKRLSSLREPEQCDRKQKGKIHAFPIMHWSELEIWEYIRKRDLPYPDFYDKGFTRLGCIGCPLANKKQRIVEYKMFPRYAVAVIKAIEKNIKAGNSLSKYFTDPWEAFYWWISENSIYDHNSAKLFEIDYKDSIRSIFKL